VIEVAATSASFHRLGKMTSTRCCRDYRICPPEEEIDKAPMRRRVSRMAKGALDALHDLWAIGHYPILVGVWLPLLSPIRARDERRMP